MIGLGSCKKEYNDDNNDDDDDSCVWLKLDIHGDTTGLWRRLQSRCCRVTLPPWHPKSPSQKDSLNIVQYCTIYNSQYIQVFTNTYKTPPWHPKSPSQKIHWTFYIVQFTLCLMHLCTNINTTASLTYKVPITKDHWTYLLIQLHTWYSVIYNTSLTTHINMFVNNLTPV